MKITRRGFLQASAATGLLVAGAGFPALQALAEGENTSASVEGKWLSTTCQGCTTWCAIQAYVVDGRVIKVQGNPNSKASHGKVCPRAHIAIQQLYDPDRVKVPMKRTNPKKGRNEDPKFVPISWEEAIDTITDKMMELRKNNEPEKYVLMRGRYSGLADIIYDATTKVFGSPNGISHSAICAEAEKFGPYYTEAYWDYRDYDLDETRCVLLWGADPIASNRQVPHAISMWGKVLDQATVVSIDPRLSATAAKSDEWMPVIPGEDGALAVAIAHVLLVEGLWNKEFVGDFIEGINLFKKGETVPEETFTENYTNGVVKWWNLELKDRTPEWAAERAGVPADQIIRVARAFGKAAPHAISWLSPGASMQVRGGYVAMATHALNGLVGSVDNVGGTLRASKVPSGTIPSYENYLDDIAKKGTKNKKIDQRGTKEFPALKSGKTGGGVVTNRLADAMLAKDPYEVKMSIGYFNNFAFSCSGAQRWEQALEQLPFYAHVTTNPAEMTQYADIVLPAAMSAFEKWAFTKSKANKVAYASIQQRVVEPIWDVKIDESEIPWMIAESMAKKGFPNLLDYFKNEFKDPETGKAPTTSMEFNMYAVKKFTQNLWDPSKEKKGDTLKGWQEFVDKGVWNSAVYSYKGTWKDFGTVSKKFEFYSETLKKALEGHAEKHKTNVDDIMEATKYLARGEQAFVPHYEEPFRWGESAEYPFVFFEHRSRLNREGRSANTLWYQEFKDVDPGDEAWGDVAKINPTDGAKLGIKTGDNIRITSPTGSITCTAKLWEGVRPGTVGKCYGQGHWAYGKIAALDYAKRTPRGGNNNEILPADFERLSGSTARHGGVTRIKIEKV
ncbi:molybdopterin-dependent oxidoreductase [Desulfosporosinus sp. BICA1-9]|uniref:molybdopterin-dependent oxidoreductase n=1 Tax=Desulfosporosinus sp. BICA1-9 TaxID=1531958 RepID=UPI00054BFF56|nr:molybdopterin-dependent oxidoreductase [Desulfosporosinus sp. BICA1-9]KJS46169.1 MAG: dehydrogenase [Peptococcaceae bacterium BRH_c23]KJS90082.1 MAG: dehydrogenase [Desulfosporosinus sp. BICA1-9]HBW36321.1 dehydrogenase [Desulfosporosinus sp.]